MPNPQPPETDSTPKQDDFETLNKNYNPSHHHFIDQNFPVGHSHNPFEKEKIEAQLESRLAHQKLNNTSLNHTYCKNNAYPHQGLTGFCGPAAFMYALLMDRPDLYKQYIIDLWLFGKADLGNLKIKASKMVKKPTDLTHQDSGKTRIPAIDWISMASLRDSSNLFFSSASASCMQIGDITGPNSLDNWFQGVGSKRIYMNISPFFGPSKFIPGVITMKDVLKFNQYIEKGHHAVLLIGSALLAPEGNQSFFTKFKNHWIVAVEPFKIAETELIIDEEIILDTNVSVKIFTWGEVKKYQFPLRKLLRYWYGGMIYTHIPSIS